MSSKFSAALQLVRPLNAGITLVSIAAAVILAGGMSTRWLTIVCASLTGAFVAGGANAINDFFDIEIDRVNRPDRPLPRGALEKQDAKLVWFILSLAAIMVNVFLNTTALCIATAAVLTLYAYSAFLKRTVVAGNVIVAAMTGLAFLYGGAAVGRFDKVVVPAIFAFLVNLARELVKDAEDVEGDSRDHAITLPVKYGIGPTLRIASAVLLLLVGATVAVYALHLYNSLYLVFVAPVDIALCYVAISLSQRPPPERLRKLSFVLKVAMLGGLVSILAGS